MATQTHLTPLLSRLVLSGCSGRARHEAPSYAGQIVSTPPDWGFLCMDARAICTPQAKQIQVSKLGCRLRPMDRLVHQDHPGPLACAWRLAKQGQACLRGKTAVCPGCGGIVPQNGAHVLRVGPGALEPKRTVS